MEDNTVNQFGLTKRDMDTINRILNKYPEVTEVHLFGSRAKGSNKLGSDIDLAIINTGVNQMTLQRLKADFADSSLPYRVDIVNLPDTNHSGLIDHIQQVGVVFYLKNSERSLFSEPKP